jgi:hypothetical protein
MEAMQRALSLKSENEQASSPQANMTSGFEIHPYDAANPDDEIGATIDIVAINPSPDDWADGKNVSAGDLTTEKKDPSIAEDHFTTIEEARRERTGRVGHPFISAPTWFLVAALLLTALIGWYFLQPPSAEALYQRIKIAAKHDRLVDTKEDVQQFLQYYPQNPQAPAVARYQSAIEAIQLKGRAVLQARLLNKRFRDSPIGAEYLVAIESSSSDPETAATHLRALVTLYKPLMNRELIGPFVRAAENQLPFIEEQAKKRVATEKKLLTERLSTARDFLEEKPQQAKSICEAICVLYRNKSWADSLVQQAKQLLKKIREQEAQ